MLEPRSGWLILALIPYALCAGYDSWIHERGQKVPRVEFWLHNALALVLLVYLHRVLGGHSALALGALLIVEPLHLTDALGFHGQIAARKRLGSNTDTAMSTAGAL